MIKLADDDVEIFSALLALDEGDSPVIHKRPAMSTIDMNNRVAVI